MPTIKDEEVDGVKFESITYDVQDGIVENIKLVISEDVLNELAEDPDIIHLCQSHYEQMKAENEVGDHPDNYLFNNISKMARTI